MQALLVNEAWYSSATAELSHKGGGHVASLGCSMRCRKAVQDCGVLILHSVARHGVVTRSQQRCM